MIFIAGTQSKRKLYSIEKVIKQIVSKKEIIIIPFPAQSGVSETPWDKETYSGAKNRALECKSNNKNADYYIGIESGLVERYGHVYEEAWSCVLTKEGKEYFGFSSGLKVPDYILKKMNDHKLPHYLIFAKLNNHFDKYINSDTWRLYTDKLLLREISIEESLRNALVQIFSSKESYYHKDDKQ